MTVIFPPVVTSSNKYAGVAKSAVATIDLNQAAASYDLFTGTGQDVLIDTLVFRMPDDSIASNGTLTSITIITDDTTASTFISTAAGAVANLTAEAQLAADIKGIYIKVGSKVQLTIAGGAIGRSVIADVEVSYRAIVNGGYLA